MSRELTIQQMREILQMRRRHARAEVVVHYRPWGIIVEARRGRHAVECMRFDWTGAVADDDRIAVLA